jgi:hypothetical protein
VSKDGELQDEWGIYDPAVCGFDALYEKLEAAESGHVVEEPETAGDRLVRAGAAPPRPGASIGQRGPRPLAMWARRPAEDEREPAVSPREPDAVRSVIRGLLVPTAIAAIAYGAGCRIRRVKVKAAAPRRKTPNAPVIILSKKLLDVVRPPRRLAA